MNAIEIKNICYTYENAGDVCTALNGVDLSVRKGEFVCILGPSGSGKSTLLNILAGLLPGYKGQASVNGNILLGPGTDRAVVFQHYSLFPWLTALKNVSFGIRRAHRSMPRGQALSSAKSYLEKVGLSGDINKYPAQLSGGMQQRVAIARALAMKPEMLLLDEPFGALDIRLRTELQQLLETLWLAEGQRQTVLFITHDVHEAILLADRIVFISEGKIKDIVSIPFERPRKQELQTNASKMNELHKEILSMFYRAGFTANDATYQELT